MAISGKSGYVTSDGGSICAKAWTIDFNADRLDSTNFCSDGWKEFVIGLKGATGSVTSKEYNSFNPETAYLVVLANDDVSFSGSVFVNSSVNTPVDDLVDYTYDIQFSGAITVS